MIAKKFGATFLGIMMLIILASCRQSTFQSTPNIPNSTQTFSSSPSTTPMTTLTLTATVRNIAITPIAAHSPIDSCLNIESSFPAEINSNGILILSGEEDIGNNLVRYTAYKINMKTHEQVEIAAPGEVILYPAVSPNGKWLAYEKYEKQNGVENIVIVDSSGTQQKIIQPEKGWAGISSWLDNERLVLHLDVTSDSNASPAMRASTFLILNPFTNERQVFSPELPDIPLGPGLSPLIGQGINQNLEQVVYLQDNGNGYFHYVLWDVKQQRSLASFAVAISQTGFPLWSQDSQQFLLAANLQGEDIAKQWPKFELFNVSRDGQVSKLTNLTDHFPWVYIDDYYNWSPDSKYVAFWFSSWADKKPDWDLLSERYLAVVDTEINTISNYCIPGKAEASGRIPAPVWSPDGKQLVIQSADTEDHKQVVLIDLEKQQAVQIGKDMKPEGWMVSP